MSLGDLGAHFAVCEGFSEFPSLLWSQHQFALKLCTKNVFLLPPSPLSSNESHFANCFVKLGAVALIGSAWRDGERLRANESVLDTQGYSGALYGSTFLYSNVV